MSPVQCPGRREFTRRVIYGPVAHLLEAPEEKNNKKQKRFSQKATLINDPDSVDPLEVEALARAVSGGDDVEGPWGTDHLIKADDMM